MKELKQLETSLEELHKDFNRQLEALGDDSKEFHKALIELTSKYPDHKELIQFIVFVNDKLETNQTLFKDIVVESFNELVGIKKTFVLGLIDKEYLPNTPDKPGFISSVIKSMSQLKDMKTLVFGVAIILFVIGVLVAPDVLLSGMKAMTTILGK